MKTSPESIDALLEAAAPLVDLAIDEDIGPGDATSLATLPPDTQLTGRIIAKAPGIIAGLPVAAEVFRKVDPSITVTPLVEEGQEVVTGDIIATVAGPGRSLLAAERIALNFLQRMSGIATQTNALVDAVAATSAKILDTRKTLPGYRVLDKYAVRMGGGTNHRMSLYDMIMIKDNHIDGSGGITRAVRQARTRYPDLPVEVEVRDFDELTEALACDPPLDRILLDNMTPDRMREAVMITAGRVALEASGNITLARAAEVAATGVDYISAGSLTHSVEALDLSMKISPKPANAVSERIRRIRQIKAKLGDRMVILGHHYQRDEIVNLADFRGDSLQLARKAIQTDAEYIVFCGVHFMAESAAVLAKSHQHVLIPDISAGCYLADTATPQGVVAAWQALDAATGNADEAFTPITYVNSTAALKAFCGRHGGSVCTSGNADQVIRWALTQRPGIFFFPDQHLGRNTAHRMGIADSDMLVWDSFNPPSADAVQASKVILWPGACKVHQRFLPEHVRTVRQQYPGIRVIVHPECPASVVDLADENGSTAYIIRKIDEATPGTQWAVGTESRLVYRLQALHPEQKIITLADVPPFCGSMSRITLRKLADLLEALARGEVLNKVTVDGETAHWAKIALERMLEL